MKKLFRAVIQHGAANLFNKRENALSLTRAARAHNLGILASAVSRFGEVEDDVVRAFREGGGVSWQRLERIQEWQPELTSAVFDVEAVLGLVPGLVELLREGIDVLDVGCGLGHASLRIADAYPASRVLGVDQAAKSIAAAGAEAERLGLGDVRFEQRDAAELEPGSADLVLAFDVVHDLARPYETLAAIRTALRPGGVFVMAEHALSSRPEQNVGHPLAAALYTVSLFHCMTASLSEHGEGIGLAWGEERIRPALAEAGFAEVEVQGWRATRSTPTTSGGRSSLSREPRRRQHQHHTATSLPVPGTTSIAHLDENLDAASIILTQDEIDAITALAPEDD